MNNDLISREALKKAITDYLERRQDVIVWEQDVYNIIDNAPTVCNDNYSMGYQDGVKKVLSERPTGHWIPKVCNFYWYKQFACSECGHEIISHEKTPNYCEKCGADMKGE